MKVSDDSLTKPLVNRYDSPTYGRYWSSTEHTSVKAWFYGVTLNGNRYNRANVFKRSKYGVRAIRGF